MSQEQQDAVLGRVVRELNVAKNKAAALTAEAHKIDAELVDLGTKLGGTPDQVAQLAVGNQPVPLQFQPVHMFNTSSLDASRLAQLLEDLRSALSAMHRLSDDAARFGA